MTMGYSIRFQVTRSLDCEDEYEPLSRIKAEIIEDEDDEVPGSVDQKVGELHAFLLSPGQDQDDIEETADAESYELHQAVCVARTLPEETIGLDIGHGKLWKPIIFVDSVIVDEAHRGKALGKLAVLRLLDVFDRNSAILVLYAHPMGGSKMEEADRKRAMAKLLLYWKGIGLDLVTEDKEDDRYGFMWFDTEYVRPTVDDLTRGRMMLELVPLGELS